MSKQPRIIPSPGNTPNTKADVLAVFQTLQAGGVAIVPTEVGYGFMASSTEAISRAFAAKKRKPGHAQGLIGGYELHRQLHVLSDEKFEMSRVLIEDLDMGLGIIAPFKADHPLIQKAFTADTLDRTTKNGTMAMYVGGSAFLTELNRLNWEAGQLMVGSSANLTGSGQKFRVEDIEDEVKEAADLIVDYGLQRYHVYDRPSILMDFGATPPKVVRKGSCYELLRERMKKFWGIELEEDGVWDRRESEK